MKKQLSLPEVKTCETCRFLLFRQNMHHLTIQFCIMARSAMSRHEDACEAYMVRPRATLSLSQESKK